MADDQTIQTMPNPQPNEAAPTPAPAPTGPTPEMLRQAQSMSPAFDAGGTDQGVSLNPGSPANTPIPTDAAADLQKFESGQEYQEGAKFNRWQGAAAGAAAAFRHSLWGPENPLRQVLQERAWNQDTGPKLSPEEANAQFPDRETPYTTAVDPRIVGMEKNQKLKDDALSDMISKSSGITGMGLATAGGGFLGGLADPINLGIGLASSGLSEMAVGEGAGWGMKLAAHYLSNWTGMTASDQFNNLMQSRMGAKRETLVQSAENTAGQAALMTGITVAARAAWRAFTERSGGAAMDGSIVRGGVRELENNRVPTPPAAAQDTLNSRANGVQVGEDGKPTLPTSPQDPRVFYAAEHDIKGTPEAAVFKAGLGDGHQVTNIKEIAHNAVADADNPGRFVEAKIPEGYKFLDLSQDAKASEEGGGFIKSLEEKLGFPIDHLLEPHETLEELFHKIGDWAGTVVEGQDGEKEEIPEDVMNRIGVFSKEQGYSGYELPTADGSGKVLHVFEPSKLELGKIERADPAKAPQLPPPDSLTPQTPADMAARQDSYSPKLDQLVHDMRSKSEYQQVWGAKALGEVNDIKANLQERLAALAKENPEVGEQLQDIKKAEAQDQRLIDIAKRIMECGDGGGT